MGEFIKEDNGDYSVCMEFLHYVLDAASDGVQAEYGSDRLIMVEITTDPNEAPEDSK